MTGPTQRVFSERVRTNRSPSGHSESTAAFLERVAGPYWDEVRDLIERWVSNLPDSARRDVVGRLRDASYAQFAGSFWELYLHETFIRSGYTVTVHPDVARSAGHPDFLVENGADAFYVEAKTLIGSVGDKGAAARKSKLYDALEKIDCPSFFLRIEVFKVGRSDLHTKPLRRALENWTASLDPDVPLATEEFFASTNCLPWSSAGWELEFRPIPVRPEHRGKPDHRPLGMFGPISANWVNDDATLRTALRDKGSAYGALDHPMVIAVNSLAPSRSDFETTNALYGTQQISISMDDPQAPPVPSRSPDGYWLAGTWAHQHVAGVLVGRSMAPWRVAEEVPTYWQHPQPHGQVTPLPYWRLAEVIVDHVEVREPPSAVATLFGLPTPWPTGEPFPREASA